MTRRRSSARFWDPRGDRYGIPTYPWRLAPQHLATRRQLAAAGLRPGGQEVVAQVLWHRSGGRTGVAYLYDTRLALPKRTPTPAQRAALASALPDCGRWTLWKRGMLKAHCADHIAGVRCAGSGQRVRLDVSPEQWLRWLPEYKAAVALAARRADRVRLPHAHRALTPPLALRRPAAA